MTFNFGALSVGERVRTNANSDTVIDTVYEAVVEDRDEHYTLLRRLDGRCGGGKNGTWMVANVVSHLRLVAELLPSIASPGKISERVGGNGMLSKTTFL